MPLTLKMNPALGASMTAFMEGLRRSHTMKMKKNPWKQSWKQMKEMRRKNSQILNIKYKSYAVYEIVVLFLVFGFYGCFHKD